MDKTILPISLVHTLTNYSFSFPWTWTFCLLSGYLCTISPGFLTLTFLKDFTVSGGDLQAIHIICVDLALQLSVKYSVYYISLPKYQVTLESWCWLNHSAQGLASAFAVFLPLSVITINLSLMLNKTQGSLIAAVVSGWIRHCILVRYSLCPFKAINEIRPVHNVGWESQHHLYHDDQRITLTKTKTTLQKCNVLILMK